MKAVSSSTAMIYLYWHSLQKELLELVFSILGMCIICDRSVIYTPKLSCNTFMSLIVSIFSRDAVMMW